ncbi:transcriptional regulator, GntR family [Tistlia consotensis]|uniref:Transcriptional regulator, GntR family n=1 Tax=Tistlia consotensis USBA 355 TaxID=560819 RepID=A0A1Y6CB30_9PROT|nr:FadR/GntR family transcriptional regulator [Tistlia consotensis]SMF55076.1 transcriptional regulator, GntR family [Tistlia consotensis USBA 355]SNR87629.1 transcriptional regulator, GntR family [Tistlia consotensis]
MTDLVLGRSAAKVLDGVRQRIQAGELTEGAQLPTERELAAAFGVARNTVRQALDRLESDGILVRQVGRGTFVRQGLRGQASAPAPAQSQGVTLSQRMREASPADLMEVRLIIEPQSAALAANRASSNDLERIREALRASISARGLAEFEHWDAQLHLRVFEATKNAVLIDYCRAINRVRDEPAWYQLKKRTVTPELRTVYDRQHSSLVEALAEHDPEGAREAMRAHLLRVRQNMLGEG